jgi:hypothetical protein
MECLAVPFFLVGHNYSAFPLPIKETTHHFHISVTHSLHNNLAGGSIYSKLLFDLTQEIHWPLSSLHLRSVLHLTLLTTGMLNSFLGIIISNIFCGTGV